MEHNNQNQQNTQSSAKQNRNLRISGAAILVVLAIIIAGSRANTPAETTDTETDVTMVEGCKEGFLFSETTGEPCNAATEESASGATPATTLGASAAGSSNMSYAEAVEAYEGKRIAIGNDCSLTPDDISFDEKTRVLFYNESGAPATFSVAGASYTLRPLHYKTLSFTAGTTEVLCGTSTATVTVR